MGAKLECVKACLSSGKKPKKPHIYRGTKKPLIIAVATLGFVALIVILILFNKGQFAGKAIEFGGGDGAAGLKIRNLVNDNTFRVELKVDSKIQTYGFEAMVEYNSGQLEFDEARFGQVSILSDVPGNGGEKPYHRVEDVGDSKKLITIRGFQLAGYGTGEITPVVLKFRPVEGFNLQTTPTVLILRNVKLGELEGDYLNMQFPLAYTFNCPERTCRVFVEQPEPRCGDGVVNQNSEQCDDGNGVDDDACSNGCQIVQPVVSCDAAHVDLCQSQQTCESAGHEWFSEPDDADGLGVIESCRARIVPDADRDTIPDATDNCPAVSNVGQADTDEDGTGDACDEAPCGTYAQLVEGACACDAGRTNPDNSFNNGCEGGGAPSCLPIGDVDTYEDGRGVLNPNDALSLQYVLAVLATKADDPCGTEGQGTCDDFADDGFYVCKNGVILGEAGQTCTAVNCASVPNYGDVTLIGDVDTYEDGRGVLNPNDALSLQYVLAVLATKADDSCGTEGQGTCDDFADDGFYVCKNGIIYGEAGHTC